MKTVAWWLAVFIPGLIAAGVLFVNADVLGPADALVAENDCGEGVECSQSPAPEGFWSYLDRIPIPEHPAVAWSFFGTVLMGVMARGVVVPIINAIQD